MTIVPNSGIVEFGTFVPPVPGDGQQGQVPKPLLAEAGYVLSTNGWIPAGGGGGSGTVTSVDLTAGTGISVSGGPITTSGSITVTNTAPDQTVTLTQAGTTTITGTYPSFTISSADQFLGTVTSVGGTGTVNGITLTGTVTSSGSLTLGGTLSGVSLTTQVSGTLPATNGGTGLASYAVGDLLFASTTTTLSTLADVATGNALISGGVGANPSYGKIGLTTHVSGTLAVANGGTGVTTSTGTGSTVLSTAPALSGATLNDGYTEEVFAVTGTTPALSPTNGSIQTWTLTASSTPTAGTWADGQSMTLMINDGTAYTVTWTSLAVTWKTDGGVAPTLNLTGFTVIQLWEVGSVIYGARVGNA